MECPIFLRQKYPLVPLFPGTSYLQVLLSGDSTSGKNTSKALRPQPKMRLCSELTQQESSSEAQTKRKACHSEHKWISWDKFGLVHILRRVVHKIKKKQRSGTCDDVSEMTTHGWPHHSSESQTGTSA